jgi:hypothetical protein
MTLTFEHLFATDGIVTVKCAISKAALTLEVDPLGGLDAMIITYRRERQSRLSKR